MTDSALIPLEESLCQAPVRNAAVQRCLAARDRSLQESLARKDDNDDANELASDAYRAAMPDLTGYENIRDFIACVTHGMITGAVHPIEAPRLLYAAQVAISALRLAPRVLAKPAKSPEPAESARLESGQTAA